MTSGESFRIDQILRQDWDFHGEKTNGLTHGLHPYPAKFIPQIPNRLISQLSQPGETVADIFCGSGTTLVEANILGRNAIGIDANPLACLISKAKTTRLPQGDEEHLQNLVRKATTLAGDLSLGKTPLFTSKNFVSTSSRPGDGAINFWFEPFVVEELAEIRGWCNALETEPSRLIALTAFSSIIVAVSKQDSDTRYVRREKNPNPGDAFRKFAQALERSIASAFQFTQASRGNSQVLYTDLLTEPCVDKFDLMVCSPPYPNAYSYHLYHMTRMIWLGMDYLDFKRREIGSHRKYSKKGASIETFRDEMRVIFTWLHNYLKPERYAVFVIGDSKIAGQQIDNAELLSIIAQKNGFREEARIIRTLQRTKRAFNPKIGRIKTENILVLTRQ